MSVTKYVALMTLSMTICHSATAQKMLTIEECRDMALSNNHEIKQAESKTEGVRSTQRSYRANYLPSINLNLIGLYSTIGESRDVNIPEINNIPVFKLDGTTYQALTTEQIKTLIYNAQKPDATMADKMALVSQTAGYVYFPGLSTSIDYEVGPMFMAGISLEQPIYMGGKIANADKIASMGVEMAEKNEVLTRTKILQNVDEAYALVVKTKEMSKVAEKYNEVLRELMRSVTKAKQHGMRTNNDVLKVQVKLKESELAVIKAQNGLTLAKMNLCHVTGQDLSTDIDVSTDYPNIEIQSGSVDQRPESSILQKKVEIAEAKTKIERSALLPEVGVMLSYNYVNGFKLMDEKLFSDGDFTALLKVKVPIFNCGKSSNKVRAAKHEAQQARLERQNLTEMMELELQQADNKRKEAEKEVEIAEETVREAEANMTSSQKSYENGMETLSDYMESQLLWQQAMAANVEAHYQLYLSKVNYNRANGTLIGQ